MELEANFVDVLTEEIYPAKVVWKKDRIVEIRKTNKNYSNFILPGLIDSHIHIESSLLCPSRFAELVTPHGTTSVITDPHEIANVLGLKGIKYMMQDSKAVPLRVFFTAPSCVPTTEFETSGAKLGTKEIEKMLRMENVVALGEVMDFLGVVKGKKDILKKIEVAKKLGKKIDGHAPSLRGSALTKYVSYGISTDHECASLQEAKEKQKLGMKIMIREGSGAKNLKDLVGLNYNNCFLVSDDKHPTDLIKGHLDEIYRKAVSLGIDPIKAIKMVTLNPALHYGLNLGVLVAGKKADFVEVDSLDNFRVKRVFINGELVAKAGKALFRVKPKKIKRNIKVRRKKQEDFAIYHKGDGRVKVRIIELVPEQIVTKESDTELVLKNNKILTNVDEDILKIVVVNRYGDERIGKGFVKGFGVKRGALASSVAHDSHNIIAIGVDDESIAKAVNVVVKEGGFCVVDNKISKLELPLAGLMSDKPANLICKKLQKLESHAKELGSRVANPFISLSFLSLLVIPELKISDKGLFNSKEFKFVEVVK
ncbi:MAG: adenine deaminase [Candidatus Thermoplasmatota archaeon]